MCEVTPHVDRRGGLFLDLDRQEKRPNCAGHVWEAHIPQYICKRPALEAQRLHARLLQGCRPRNTSSITAAVSLELPQCMTLRYPLHSGLSSPLLSRSIQKLHALRQTGRHKQWQPLPRQAKATHGCRNTFWGSRIQPQLLVVVRAGACNRW